MDAQFSGCRSDWQDEGAVFFLTRPARLNALTKSMLDGLDHCLDEVERRGARSLVIIGEGERAFCAGTDLAEAQTLSAQQLDAKTQRARTLLFRLSQSAVLSVAAINGLAYGGGLELAMACTLRIAAPHADLCLPEIKLGVLPSYGGTQFLPALIGAARALDLMLTGRAVGADEALTMGLVSRIADPAAPLLEQARALAGSVTQYSQLAIDGVRRCVAAAGATVTEAGLAAEAVEVRALTGSADAKEGIAAFLEKRKPVFNRR